MLGTESGAQCLDPSFFPGSLAGWGGAAQSFLSQGLFVTLALWPAVLSLYRAQCPDPRGLTGVGQRSLLMMSGRKLFHAGPEEEHLCLTSVQEETLAVEVLP